jgi:type III secretion system FlhB-like substrate exporter
MSSNHPIKKVVGLAYEPQTGELPHVVFKGCGEMADRMLQERDWLAGPTVVKDAALVDQLYRLPMDGPIVPAGSAAAQPCVRARRNDQRENA